MCVGVARVKWSSRADMEDRTELTFIYELVDLSHYNFVITNSVTTKLFLLICALPQLHLIILPGSGC